MAKSSTGGRVPAAIFLLISIVLAGMFSLMVFVVIRTFQQRLYEAKAPPALVEVVQASRPLWPGMTISELDLETRTFPPDFVPKEAMRDPANALGRVPVERILKSEFIRSERLAKREAGTNMAAIIPQGMRGISLDISGGSAVAGFINPGNYVDILLTVDDLDRGTLTTITLLQAVSVLAVNDRLGGYRKLSEEEKKMEEDKARTRGRSAAPSITIAVTPDQAEKVTHAKIEGTVTLTLRNDIDVTQYETHARMDTSVLIGKAGEDGNRIDMTEFNQRIPQDGTMIIIKGDTETTEKTRLQ